MPPTTVSAILNVKHREYNRLGINAAARILRITPALFCATARIGNSITACAPTIQVPQSSGTTTLYEEALHLVLPFEN